jgi:predicted transcriptional regulator
MLMKREEAKRLILEFLEKHPDSQAQEITDALNAHKSTIISYLQELESDTLIRRHKVSYQSYWSLNKGIDLQRVLRCRWDKNLFIL